MGNSSLSHSIKTKDKTGLHNSIPTKPEDKYPEFLKKFGAFLLERSVQEERTILISKTTFQKYLCQPYKPLGEKLFQYFLLQETASNKDLENPNAEMSVDTFLMQTNALLNCLTDFQQLEYYTKVFAMNKEDITYDEFYDLVITAYEFAQFSNHTSSSPDNLLSAISKAVMHGKEKVMYSYALHWLCEHCPRIVMWIHRYLKHVLTVRRPSVSENENIEEESDNDTPVLDSANSSSCVTLHPALIWMLSCTLPQIYTKSHPKTDDSTDHSPMMDPHKFINQVMLAHTPTHWIPLYNSDNDGFSMNRFQHHVFGYNSPTLLFITTEDNMFCVAVDEGWKDSKHFFGGYNSMCIQLTPKYQVIEKGNNLIYFNTTSRGFPMGFQIGVDSTCRALTLDPSWNLVYCRKVPYQLKSLEVWGCGTTCAKEKQQEVKHLANRDVESRRKVKLNSNDWVDHPDRCLLEMAGARPTYAMYEKDTQRKFSAT